MRQLISFDSPNVLYFSYGSNLHPERLRNRKINPKSEIAGHLFNYRLCFNKSSSDGSGKCHIRLTGNPKDVVYGAIFPISSNEMKVLRLYEEGYDQARLQVQTDGGSIEVETFTACNGTTDLPLKPYTWYKEWVLRGAMYHGFPKEIIDEIQAVEAVEDIDKIREEINLSQIRKFSM